MSYLNPCTVSSLSTYNVGGLLIAIINPILSIILLSRSIILHVTQTHLLNGVKYPFIHDMCISI